MTRNCSKNLRYGIVSCGACHPRVTKCENRHHESQLCFKVCYGVALVRNVSADSKKAIIRWINTQKENYHVQYIKEISLYIVGISHLEFFMCYINRSN
jgi:hypothetical protein